MPTPPMPVPTGANPLLGIGLKVLSVIVFVAMQSSLKAGGEGVPPGQLVFFRSFFALIPVVIYLAWLGELRTALRTDDLPGHVLRGVVGVVSMGLGFYALTRLPYPEWVTISYAAPLLTVVFAVIFLKEVVRAYRWAAVAIGLVGIVIVSAPNFTALGDPSGSAHATGALAALAGAAVAAVAMIQIRRLVRKEKTATIVVYFSLTSSLVALVTLPFGWVWLTPWQALLLIVAGFCGGVGQLLLTACYRHADTSTIAPFEYTSLVFAVAIGALVFDEPVGASTLVGGAIVVMAGIFIILRERQLGIERARARKVSPPQG
ncbi:DMT family transporter [Aureimonas populi]|uniref:DMT family transporter n=1 Tax=Aureimonas populi TaxID=1701758 RepID=A0ABW5CLN2_9HYPH|nr:DMT family transporter [Aureimonas populi]